MTIASAFGSLELELEFQRMIVGSGEEMRGKVQMSDAKDKPSVITNCRPTAAEATNFQSSLRFSVLSHQNYTSERNH